ncbi:unnamed protein product [Aphanomyces euteiches]|uniref:Vacuolar membrane-associated protein IML1 n=1 Tax=Aphanomyces euteiches TaxID=100861 RepID=A0A6G0WPY6_9STRA|nr:hypothetical protein Ae201684_012929 [Aphanomyces euteiches]KAH9097551.1 hypothetical protein Ae201684P_001029 [Aphanomyces euteiches]KAH9154023.1 hypothetical protein AeRB84_003822 [Aphanomyces euteiches]
MNRRRWTRPKNTPAPSPPPSTKDVVDDPITKTVKKSKQRAIFKLHVHGLEFHGGEELVLNPDALKQDLSFPEDDDHVMEIYTPNDPDDSRRHLLLDIPSVNELKAKKPVKGTMHLSLLKDTAAQFQLQVLQDVVVRFVEKHTVEVDFVEVTMKDQFLSRRDVWYLQHALIGKAVYVGKMVRMHGARLQVMELVHEQENVTSGVISSRTRFVFRSKSSRIFWLVQVSPELWDTGNNGDLYADELIRMVSLLVDRWQNTSHGVTIILFARNYYDNLPPPHSIYYSPAIVQDDDGRWFEDFYKVISYGKATLDMSAELISLKAEVNAFPHLCGWELGASTLTCKGGNGRPSSAKEGNVLEAINLVLNIYEKHYLDRDLNLSGQNLALFTAGNGMFRVNQRLSEMTEQRMMDNGIGFDCISLSTPPLTSVPRFFIKGYHRSKGQQAAQEDYQPMWFSVRFSQHSSSSKFTPLPVCRLFAPPVGTPSRPLAFLLTQLQLTNHQTLQVPESPPTPLTITLPPTPTPPIDLDLQLQRQKLHIFSDDYDDDVFTVRSTSISDERSPALQCGTPPLHSLGAKGRKIKSFVLSPELKPAMKSPMNPLFLPPPQSRSYQSPMGSPPTLASPANRPNNLMARHGSSSSMIAPSYIAATNSNKRRWSQVYRYEMLGYDLDFKSLCTPALLPLTTDYMPSPQDLKWNITESFYTVTLPDQSDYDASSPSLFTTHRELVLEMVAQRFSQDFQLMEESHNGDTTVYKLSMGHRIHEITYYESRQEIVVKILQQSQAKQLSRVAYPYSLWSPLTSAFMAAKQDFRYPHHGDYAWNYLDSLICGHSDEMTDNIKYKRGLYCILPPLGLSLMSESDRQHAIDEFVDRMNRLLEYIRSKAKDGGQKVDVKIAPYENKVTRRVKQGDVKIPLAAADAPLQQQWLNIHLDLEVVPIQVFHVEIQWLVCRSTLVDDFILGLQRRAKQFNLDMIAMPENCGATTMDVHPLIYPVYFPLNTSSEFALVEYKLTMEFNFCLEGIHRIPNDMLTSEYMKPFKAPSALNQRTMSGKSLVPQRTYRQFIHRSLSCFVRLTEVGVIWISSRRMHSPEMQALFCQLKIVIRMIAVMTEMKNEMKKPGIFHVLPDDNSKKTDGGPTLIVTLPRIQGDLSTPSSKADQPSNLATAV